ncbi:XRE family transcriptional regulator [Myceligenerans salitolerans]|uniref:XRE family transcriptional regulator n=1 Tax=Myceligenerans salitolerans TaxID=1230528 RepID=A0ABS3I8K8_9MICO|nr:XRE family transcriptional regulator [Myceligenerans salitolerans]MBO0609351.1 XRE family transcriptional regulator [Myceligenerans salitolerans]
MSNERLRAAMTDKGLTIQQLGEEVGVDPKTVERWITKDRTPHRTHRMKTAAVLGKTDVYLWPSTESDPRTKSAARAEFVDLYPTRATVSVSTWIDLIENAKESIDLLAFGGSFLHDSIPEFGTRISARAHDGVRVRMLFGDPDSAGVARRGEEEGIDDLLSARCRLTWSYLKPILGNQGIEARKHGSTLYASIYRFDDTLMANVHAYGAPAGQSPIMHINRIPGGRLFAHYMESFERTWEGAEPV